MLRGRIIIAATTQSRTICVDEKSEEKLASDKKTAVSMLQFNRGKRKYAESRSTAISIIIQIIRFTQNLAIP